MFDYTTDRLDEYSRIIVVDGNIGAGKTTVAKTIAKAFDMLYLPGRSSFHPGRSSLHPGRSSLQPVGRPFIPVGRPCNR